MTSNTLAVGDVVARTVDGREGVIRAVDVDAATFVIFWFALRATGGGWRASDLTFVRSAADDATRRTRVQERRKAEVRAALYARVREAARLPEWHADEIEDEIDRVNACADVDAYRAASRAGAATPLGAKQKIAIWRAIRPL